MHTSNWTWGLGNPSISLKCFRSSGGGGMLRNGVFTSLVTSPLHIFLGFFLTVSFSHTHIRKACSFANLSLRFWSPNPTKPSLPNREVSPYQTNGMFSLPFVKAAHLDAPFPSSADSFPGCKSAYLSNHPSQKIFLLIDLIVMFSAYR